MYGQLIKEAHSVLSPCGFALLEPDGVEKGDFTEWAWTKHDEARKRQIYATLDISQPTHAAFEVHVWAGADTGTRSGRVKIASFQQAGDLRAVWLSIVEALKQAAAQAERLPNVALTTESVETTQLARFRVGSTVYWYEFTMQGTVDLGGHVQTSQLTRSEVHSGTIVAAKYIEGVYDVEDSATRRIVPLDDYSGCESAEEALWKAKRLLVGDQG